MESKNDSTGVCEKLFKAVTGSSSHRRSGSGRRPKVTVIDSSNLQNADKSGTAHVPVPLKIQCFDHSKKKEESASVFLNIEGGHEDVFSSLKEGRVAKVRPSNPIVIEGHDHLPPKNIENHERFTEYISQVRDKMRSKSSVGDRGEYTAAVAARPASRKDSFNDRVANHIHRARKNIRTPSNVGDT